MRLLDPSPGSHSGYEQEDTQEQRKLIEAAAREKFGARFIRLEWFQVLWVATILGEADGEPLTPEYALQFHILRINPDRTVDFSHFQTGKAFEILPDDEEEA